VQVTISAGPETVLVPNVRGMQVDEARQVLTDLGFEVEIEERGGFRAFLTPGRVFDQDPGPDAPRHRGDVVTLFAYES